MRTAPRSSALRLLLTLLAVAACSDDDGNPPVPDSAAATMTCDEYAETVCTRVCECVATCKVFYPSQSSQLFGTKSVCTSAMKSYCVKGSFNRATCKKDLPGAKCASAALGSGFALPDSCFSY